MPDVSTIARRFRESLIAGEDRAYRRMRREWQRVQRAVAAEVAVIERRLVAARAAGVPAERMVDLLNRERRLETLAAAVDEQVARFSESARIVAAAHAEAAATIAPVDARAMIGWGAPAEFILDTVRLPVGAVEQLVAQVRSPQFVALFDMTESGRRLARAMGDELRDGLALGQNPKRIASRMRAVAAATAGHDPLPLSRARTIARTEALRAYRDASVATYAQNTEVVSGWIWVAALDRRTCGSCIAQHGSEHPLDEQMASHPNCRCVPAPLVRPWRELGLAGGREPDPVEAGAHWFARQPERAQVAILGRSKAAAVRSRRIALSDLVQRENRGAWGPSTREASLAQARRNAERRRALQQAA